jgi:hypothetical protein
VRNGTVVFERDARIPSDDQANILITPHPDRLNELMPFLMKRVLDNPGAHPGITKMLIRGPAHIATEAGGIVLKASSLEDAQRAAEAIGAFAEKNGRLFLPGERPACAARVAIGVALGEEPRVLDTFAGARSDAIWRALERLNDTNDLHVFTVLVEDELEKRGIDPDHPDRNLPVTT